MNGQPARIAVAFVAPFFGFPLFGVSPLDAGAVGGAMAFVVGITCLASYVPARAATRVNPVHAQRAE
jgi:ABC-type antimicrobial peptide transport system permease subunit